MLKLYENIKKLRTSVGMTQRELAERLGYSDRSTITRIEKGDIDLSQSKIKQIADIFNVPLAELIGHADNQLSRSMILRMNLKYYLDARNVGIEEISNVTGIDKGHVLGWLTGRGSLPNYEELSRIANYLEVEPLDLLEENILVQVRSYVKPVENVEKPALRDGYSEKRKQLIDFAMTVPEDKLAMILRLAKSVVEDE